MINQSFMLHGEDGYSLFCAQCGQYEYTGKPVDGVAHCRCGAKHQLTPREVLCASPDHNETEGCSNEKCWKYHSA